MPPIEQKTYSNPLDEVYEQVVGRPYSEPPTATESYNPGSLLDGILADVTQESPISENVSVPPETKRSAASDFLWSLFGKVLLQKWAANSLFKYFDNELRIATQEELPAYYQDYQRFSRGEEIPSPDTFPGKKYVDAMNKKFDSEITPPLKSVASWLKDLFRRDSERARHELWDNH